MTARLKIEIAGGGIAGLTAAAALAQRGHSVRVHESGDELREIGAGLYLKRNSLEVLKRLEIFDELVKYAERLHFGEIRDEHNRLLLRRTLGGEEAYTVLRGRLHELLASAARAAGAQIVLSSKVVGANPDGVVAFANGDSARADLIIGADGVNSAIRDSVGLTKANDKLLDGAIRLLIPRVAADRGGLSTEYWSSACRAGVVPCSPDHVYVFLIGPQEDSRVSQVPVDKAFWRQQFPQITDVIDRIPSDVGRFSRHAFVTVNGWSRGRVAILGDAAHAQPPNLGQGAGMSMANAAALAELLDMHDDVGNALAAWEASRRSVSEAVQRWSYRYGVLGYRWPSAFLGLRSMTIRAIGAMGPTSRRWGWLWRGGMNAPLSAL
ncbi:FAD-dependent oxidoreductase [Bradyrhizobium diazoefficiens]|uniref:FAD-dependent oxidoreductase n=1 Tax=Bradyrhizobium diazoefficiens TaxID=1355477 RepID=UPI00346F0564